MNAVQERVIRVGVAGVSGYTGQELVRWLGRHPDVELVAASSESQAGRTLKQIWPGLSKRFSDVRACTLAELREAEVDVVFLCLPHGQSAEAARDFVQRGVRVIDLSADFRLPDAVVYAEWYGDHPLPELLKEAKYGIPELYRDRIRGATIVANPGCYPTATLLALVPLLRDGLIEPEGIVVDAKSGLSGAGRTPKPHLHFVEANENLSPYSPGRTHRHVPEMEWYLSEATGQGVQITFVPHLIPMDRGILATVYVRKRAGAAREDVLACWRAAYRGEPFIDILEDRLPATKAVSGTNRCQLATQEGAGEQLVLFAAIDNLVKGASGQALQNMNLLFGLDERTGLE